MAVRAFPIPQTEAGDTGRKTAERKLLDRLDELEDEGKAAREKALPAKTVETSIDLYRGLLGPTAGQEPYFKVNFIEAFVDRMVAQLTDNRPAFMVEARKTGLAALARVLDACSDNVWEESAMQRMAWKLGLMAATMGSAGLVEDYDPTEDRIFLEVISNRQMWCDPAVREAALIGQQAEYLGIDKVRALADIVARFPLRGPSVEADVSILEDEDDRRAKSVLGPIETVIRRLAGRRSGSGTASESSGLDRARVKQIFVRDRTRDPGGLAYFPTYRRIIRSEKIILADGPLHVWDGEIPLDWYDWSVDPEHPWGSPEPEGLRHMQSAYNMLIDGNVSNHLVAGFVQFMGEHDAFDDKTWKLIGEFEKKYRALVLRKKSRNSTGGVVVPQPFGADTVSLAKFIFVSMQLKTGITDVTLGEHPGSLQSGAAIEGLQEGASLMNRSRQSRLEDLYTRAGQKLIARVLQFMTADQILAMLGPTADAIDAAFKRNEFFVNDQGHATSDAEKRDFFKYLRFSVIPGSSRPGARQQRGKMMIELQQRRMVDRLAVLQSIGIPDPQAMIARADAEWPKLNPPPPPPKQ